MEAAQQIEDLTYALNKIVKKSYLREGAHQDCHVHPELIEAGRTLLSRFGSNR